jgi:group I intron endonuclease
MKNQSGIYKIQSVIKPERIYIGSAMNISERWHKHLMDLGINKHHSIKLQNHVNKYGIEDLSFSIIEPCFPDWLMMREQYYMDKLKPYFNMSLVASNTFGVRKSSESIKKGAEKRRGQKRTPAQCKKISESHKGQTPWNKGKRGVYSEETLQKIRKARRLQQCPRTGKKATEETLQKMRIANIGKKLSLKTKEKLRISSTGRKHRPESIEKIRNRPISEETHKRRKEGALRMWQIRKLKKELNNSNTALCN